MARASLEEQLAELKGLRERGYSEQALTAVRKALSSRAGMVVAKAADLAAQWEAQPLTPALEQAFDRFMLHPVRDDKGCKAKSAIADALHRIGAESAGVFLRGIRHVQMEPEFGGPVDTAPRLRGLCALGLVRMTHPESMNELARLLADRQADARIMAARAIAYSGDPRGEPLLRYKAHVGDPNLQVLSECLLALLRLAGEAAVDFVAAYLNDGDGDHLEAAAVALGESRLTGAIEPLQQACRLTVDEQERAVLLLALAASRSEQAVQFLLAQLADSEGTTAETVLTALATLRFDPGIRDRAATVVDQKGDRRLTTVFNKSFNA